MEYQEQSAFELRLNEQAVDALRGSAKWSFFLAIVGFIGIAFMVVAALFIGSIFSAGPAGAMLGSYSGVITGVYLLFAAIYFFPIYYLFKYATDMKAALASNNSDLVSNALTYLKSHHKFLGIAIIVIFSLYLIFAIGMVVFFASAVR